MPEIAEPDEMSDAFPSSDVEETETETATEETKADSVDEQNAENATALLPKSALGKNVKEGDKITLTVTKLHGEEVMVSLSSKSKTEKTEPKSADEDIDSLAGKY